MPQAPAHPGSEERTAATRCPTCGAEAEPGQLVCLECGSRIALGYRKPPTWRLPAAIIGVVALVILGLLLLGIHEITSSANNEVSRDQAAERPNPAKGPAVASGEPAAPQSRAPAKKAKPAKKAATPKSKAAKPKPKPEPKPAPVASGSVRTWPAGTSAYAVVLVSTDSRANAEKVAKRAVREGVDGAGILRSDDYPNLGRGLWISFGGVYKEKAKAEKDAKRFDRGFPGAFVQFVKSGRR